MIFVFHKFQQTGGLEKLIISRNIIIKSSNNLKEDYDHAQKFYRKYQKPLSSSLGHWS